MLLNVKLFVFYMIKINILNIYTYLCNDDIILIFFKYKYLVKIP